MKLKEIDIHLTNRCNFSCRTCCYTSNEMALGELTKEQIIQVVDDAINLGCEDFHFSGGEPFLRTDLFDLIENVLSKKVNLRVQTNGKLLTRKNAEILYKIGLKDIMISLDGHTREICDNMRGNGSYVGAITGIKNALEAHLNVRVNAVLTKYNWSSFLEIIKMVDSMGVKVCSSFYFTPIGRGAKNQSLWLTPRNYIKIFDELTDQMSKYKLNSRDMDIIIEKAYANWDEAIALSVDGFTGCGGGCSHVFSKRDYLIIRCDGNIYPCILLIDTPFSLGNIKNQPMREIWQYAKNWDILDRKQARDECGKCKHLKLCNGGCAGYAYIFLGKYNRSDPRCIKGEIVPLCPIMKYNFKNDRLGGSSDDVLEE